LLRWVESHASSAHVAAEKTVTERKLRGNSKSEREREREREREIYFGFNFDVKKTFMM
jgi:hypothetical protein